MDLFSRETNSSLLFAYCPLSYSDMICSHLFWISRWRAKCKKLERDAEKHRKISERSEQRCVELEQDIDAIKEQRSTIIQQFEQLKKQFTDILVCLQFRLFTINVVESSRRFTCCLQRLRRRNLCELLVFVEIAQL